MKNIPNLLVALFCFGVGLHIWFKFHDMWLSELDILLAIINIRIFIRRN